MLLWNGDSAVFGAFNSGSLEALTGEDSELSGSDTSFAARRPKKGIRLDSYSVAVSGDSSSSKFSLVTY